MTEQLLSEGLIGGLRVDTGRMEVNMGPEYQPLIGNWFFFFKEELQNLFLGEIFIQGLIEDVLTFAFGSQ